MSLIHKIKKKEAKIAVIGLGYVGLELALNISNSGFEVLGFDNDQKKINILRKNKSPINTIQHKRIKKFNTKNIFSINKIKLIQTCDILIICVPTPLKNQVEPDMRHIKDTLKLIYSFLKQEQLLIVESTVYPGATEEIFLNKINQKKNLKVGKNFYLSFSPERVSPGKDYKIPYTYITKIISGHSKKCLSIIRYFYKFVFNKIYSTSSIKLAEFTKLYENAYRSVNIGLVNQMKMIADSIDLNIFDIIKAAKTKPYGFRPFIPGPGVGGHCIPIDPLFISWVSDKKKMNSDFIKISRKVNLDVTNWLIKKILHNLNRKINKILLIGVAYKRDVDDVRESPLLKVFEKLKKNHNIKYFDPYIKKIYINKSYVNSIKNLKRISEYDAVIIGTDHSNLDYNFITKHSKKIFDTRGVLNNKRLEKIINC